MALSVVGERALWLNLSGLPDSEKRRIAGAPVEPGQALFGPAVALMQQRCDDKKEEDEAFKLCLPRKAAPRQVPPARAPIPPATGQNFHQGKDKPRTRPAPRQGNILLQNLGEERRPLPRENPLPQPPRIRNASGRPDVQPMGAPSLCSRATSPTDYFPAPELLSKRRRIAQKEVIHPMCSVDVECSRPRFKGSVVRKSVQAVSPHRSNFVPLTQIKASAHVFPNTKHTNTPQNKRIK